MVPADGTHQLDQQVFVVNPLKETAVYVERMPGGVRGGGREAPLYSIYKTLPLLTFAYDSANAGLPNRDGPHWTGMPGEKEKPASELTG